MKTLARVLKTIVYDDTLNRSISIQITRIQLLSNHF